MTEYARPLWLGGGISYEALEVIEETLRGKACTIDPANPAKMELMNVANACRAEIQRKPTQRPVCDLI